MSAETLRPWAYLVEGAAGGRPGVTTNEAEEIKCLKREVSELSRANELAAGAVAKDRPG